MSHTLARLHASRKRAEEPETASENPNGFVEKCDVPTGPVPTDSDRAKAKAALGELGEVTTAVEAVARLVAETYRNGHDDGWNEGLCK